MSGDARPTDQELFYDWNSEGIQSELPSVKLLDETLRDGIQCPSVTDPPIEAKLEMIRLMDALGVHHIDVGLPGAGKRARQDVVTIVEMIRDEGLQIQPACAARTLRHDIDPIVDVAQEVGVPIEVLTFLGTSPIRLFAEGWDEAKLEKLTRDAVRASKDGGVPVCFVTEDTVRSNPQTLERLWTAAIEEGVDGLCLCDTVGHATPDGTVNLIRFAQKLISDSGTDTQLDWHGHNDRGFGLINALAAIEAGVDRVHGCVLGMGERVGNTPLDLLLVNLKLYGGDTKELGALAKLVDIASEACDWPIPVNYPVFGQDAFRTGTGVHAAAVIKAQRIGDDWLADRIYSGVPASWFGRKQEIEIGHMSGDSNIIAWLNAHDVKPEDELVSRIRTLAKARPRLLTTEEVMAVVSEFQA